MNRKFYPSIPNKEQVLEFLMLNPHCPRSINYSLDGISRYFERLNHNEIHDSKSISFKIGKLCSTYKYLTFDDYKDDIYGLLNSTQDQITEFGSELEKKYLSF
jgi:uncharacterized alpha-E superfamily protein